MLRKAQHGCPFSFEVKIKLLSGLGTFLHNCRWKNYELYKAFVVKVIPSVNLLIELLTLITTLTGALHTNRTFLGCMRAAE